MDLDGEMQHEALMTNTREEGSTSRNEALTWINKRKFFRLFLFVFITITTVFLFFFFVNRSTQENEQSLLNSQDLFLLKHVLRYYKIDDDINSNENIFKTVEEKLKENKEENESAIEGLLKFLENESDEIKKKKLSSIIEKLLNYNEVNIKKEDHILLNSVGKNDNQDEKNDRNSRDTTSNELDEFGNDEKTENALNNMKYLALFQEYTQTYNKKYKSLEEEINKFEVFKRNYKKVEKHNRENRLYKMGINHFSDFSEEELNKYFKKLSNVPHHKIKKHAVFFQEQFKEQLLKKDGRIKEHATQMNKGVNRGGTVLKDKEKLWSRGKEEEKEMEETENEETEKEGAEKEEKEKEGAEKEGAEKEDENDTDIDSYPIILDYRAQGIINEISDQGTCGSCYSFSAVANIESLYAKKNNKLVNFSEQEIVDCSSYSFGCDGGHPFYAFLYVEENGLCLQDDYKYIGKENLFCLTYKCSSKVWLRGIGYVEDDQLIKALNVVGPLTVNVAPSAEFIFYKSGIFNGPCENEISHSVLLIGYGQIKKDERRNVDHASFKEVKREKSENKKFNVAQNIENKENTGQADGDGSSKENEESVYDVSVDVNNYKDEKDDDETIYYWILKNSWGKGWGENGFMRIIRNKNGDNKFCGIGIEVFYPIL